MVEQEPLWNGRIKGLRRTFPDARFVYLVRDPRKVVPSTASLLWAALEGVGAVGSKDELMPMVHEICTRFYTETLDHLADLPPERLVVVRQEDLVVDLDGTVGAMLGQLGLPYTDALRAQVAVAAARGPRSQHRYELAEWGLTEADIRSRYGDIMVRWGYKGEAGSVPAPAEAAARTG